MDLRHELKHEISPGDMLILRQRLRAVMRPDQHAEDGRYLIRSLYFDSPSDKALREKINGVSRREKFRLRYYYGDTSLIRLEKKSKWCNLVSKESAVLTADEVGAVLEGDAGWMLESDSPLLREFYCKAKVQQLMPKAIVDYTREPFVYGPGNVRVTLDYDIRTAISVSGFLDPDCPTIPAGDAPAILEVKWDEFLPSVIRDAVGLRDTRTSAFSKYAQCRVYG